MEGVWGKKGVGVIVPNPSTYEVSYMRNSRGKEGENRHEDLDTIYVS
jgi:hypothetical protein